MRRLLILLGAVALAVGLPSAGADTGFPPFISLSVSGSGTVNDDHGNSCSTSCTFGYGNAAGAPPPPNVTFAAAPAAGWSFQGWGGECSGTGACTVGTSDPAQSHSISAGFAPSRFRLEVSVSGNGRVTSSPAGIDCGTTCSATFESGTQVTLTASAGAGATFGAWGGDCGAASPSNTCVVTMNQDRFASASFGAQQFRLLVSVAGNGRVTSSPPGIDCGATCGASFDSGAQVTLTASSGADATFGGWGGDCAASAASTTCALTMSQDRSASASFAALPPTPVARYVPPAAGAALDRLVFDARPTTAGTPVVRYRWDFAGDGHFDASCPGSDPIALHAFDRPGTYAVGLLVTDMLGGTATVHHTITVSGTDGPPIHAPSRVQPSPRPGVACGHTSTPAPSLTGVCVDTIQTGLITASTLATCFEEGSVEGASGEFVPGESSERGVQAVAPQGVAFVDPETADALTIHRAWRTDGPVNVNGLIVTPRDAAAVSPGCTASKHLCRPVLLIRKEVVISEYTAYSKVVAPNADLGLRGLRGTLATGQALEVLTSDGAAPELPPLTLPDVSAYNLNLFGWRLNGAADLRMVKDGVQVGLQLAVPYFPSDEGTPSVKVVLHATWEHGLEVDDIVAKFPELDLGAAKLKDIEFQYHAQNGEWFGQGGATFTGGAGLRGWVRFIHDRFDGAGIEALLPDPGFPLQPVPPIYLEKVGIAMSGFEVPPRSLRGTAEMNIGGKVTTAAGELKIAKMTASTAVQIDDPWGVSSDGALEVFGIPSGQVHMNVRGDGTISIGGGVDFDFVGLVIVRGLLNLDFWQLSHFNLDVQGELSFGPFVRVGGSLGASRRGVGACASLKGPFGSHWHPGIGITWDFAVQLLPHSCGVGRWEETPPGHSLAAFDGPDTRTVVVEPGPGTAIRATGASGAPRLVLTGPSGLSFTTPAAGTLQGPRWLAFADDRARQTGVLLRARRRETWVVAAAPGSPDPVRIESAGLLPPPTVHARVTGRAHARVLHYRLVPLPGQRVTFLERGGSVSGVVGVAHGGAGAIAFAPADGPAGRRAIVAVVEQAGLPRARLVVAHYRAPSWLLPGRPARVSVRRVRGGVRVAFGRAAGATAYAVGVRTGDGRLYASTTRSLSAVVHGPTAADRLLVRVVGLAAHGRHGPAAIARLAPTRGALGPSSAPPLAFYAPARVARGRPFEVGFALRRPARVVLSVQREGHLRVADARTVRPGLVVLRYRGEPLVRGSVLVVVTSTAADGTTAIVRRSIRVD